MGNNGIFYQTLDENKITDLPKDIPIDYGVQGNKDIAQVDLESQEVPLDVSGLPIEVEIERIGDLPNESYALLRRNGFGASDSSILLGVNPYKNIEDLIKEKATTTLSEEEKAIGEKVAVRKGNDLEPMIIMKYEKAFGTKTIKPVDMYKFKNYSYLKINYDGITLIDGVPYPVEIKVCTYYGEKHYNPEKAIYSEGVGFRAIPQDCSDKNWSVETKAAYYGIPPYYYTQLQQEMMGCDAPWGQLTVLFDKSWKIHTFFVWRDKATQNEIIIRGYKAWQKVEQLRMSKGLTIADFTPDLSVKAEDTKSRTSMLEHIRQETQKANELT